ncbi:UNVERIFIED_CONTAM: hypothetical protein Slati_3413700 [Sesamum latifolium]|uniref:DUF4283 domain-containing protein n=1 Tax=Sesamum latifolium TaxID=2727402 RepID=A0AAW2UGW4_9LAMI
MHRSIRPFYFKDDLPEEEEAGDEFITRVKADFKFKEFFDLASRVLDGDGKSIAALQSLRRRWRKKVENPPTVIVNSPGPSDVILLESVYDDAPGRILKSVKDRKPTPYKTEHSGAFQPRRNIFLPTNVEPSHMVVNNIDKQLVVYNPDMHTPLIMDSSAAFIEDCHRPAMPIHHAENSLNSKPLTESIQPDILIGNIKLQATRTEFVDVIAGRLSQIFEESIKVYSIGNTIQLDAYAKSVWSILKQVTATSSSFYFFQFSDIDAMESVIEGGPWLFQGQPIVLRRWEPGMSLRKQKHTQVPIWVQFKHLRIEYWTEDGLNTVASGVGYPLYTDAMTKSCLRLDYARVCIMLDYNSTLPKHLIVMNPIGRTGSVAPCKVDIEYEWLPKRCNQCKSLGHSAPTCPDLRRNIGKPVTVFVKKCESTLSVDPQDVVVEQKFAEVEVQVDTGLEKPCEDKSGIFNMVRVQTGQQSSSEDRNSQGNLLDPTPKTHLISNGKEIAISNSFALPDMESPSDIDLGMIATEHLISGPNTSNPQSVDP